MNKIQITIGLCVKNEEKNILRTLESINNQSFPKRLMELVAVDDGSEDKTLSIMLDFISKLNISSKIFHCEWNGLGPARNTILQNAQGKYILWIDGDMILPKNYMKILYEFMEQSKNAGIIKAGFRVINFEKTVSWLEKVSNLLGDIRHEEKQTPIPLGIGGAICRVKALREVGGFDNNVTRSGEDIDVEFKLRELGWLIFKTNKTFFYKFANETWKSLWQESMKYGYGGHYLYHKYRGKTIKQSLTTFYDVLLNIRDVYKLTHNRKALLLPFYYFFKKLAWSIGFIKAHLDGYGHQVSHKLTAMNKYRLIYSS
jgi:glycosyltransferase involved in cell wall biosynthesis